MVEALPPKGADDAFHVGSLPGRARSSENLLDAHAVHLLSEVVAEDAITIPQQIPGRVVPREGITELLGGPLAVG